MSLFKRIISDDTETSSAHVAKFVEKFENVKSTHFQSYQSSA